MNETEHINRAIAAHAQWKTRLRQAIESGKSEWTPDSVRPDNRCDFGKWLHSVSPKETVTERWKKIKALHAEFHKEAARILALAVASRKAEAEAAIALGSQFSKTSADLTLALVDWRESIGGR
jgi:hypothetical protein